MIGQFKIRTKRKLIECMISLKTSKYFQKLITLCVGYVFGTKSAVLGAFFSELKYQSILGYHNE